MKTLVFGPRSYLAQHFLASLPGVSASEADIADPAAVAAELDREKPDVVINCAGKTGRPNIDWCETHKEETVRGNVTGPLVLLEECGKRGIYWVHLSSGCIYEGDNGGRGFAETDEPNFHGSFYSRSKIWSDQILREFPTGPEGKGGVLILRLRMPFGNELHPRSLISKIAKYSKVLDEPNSITYLPDFLRAAEVLIAKRATGIYHIVNPGALSPFEIMGMYRDIVDPSHSFERLPVTDLGTVAKTGRSNCILSANKLEKEGITMLPVKEAVEQALRAIAAAKREAVVA